MKLPRVNCAVCDRAIAAGPVAGQIRRGRVWRHDAPGARRGADGSLVSCPGSLGIVDMPMPGEQPLFELPLPLPLPESAEADPVLFVI
ncbi:hypothetical protein ACFUN8_05875 [Streptomyces sp. NPDC057307]|uniref:hypothetical protein n=1 Tax=Streptomyces sp. NPDC057307 TaxID=3346096 RepID=UPI00363CCB9F